MNNIVPVNAANGEIIPPMSTVSVYGTTHPLNAVAGARIHCEVEAGLSIAEILEEALNEKPGCLPRRDLVVRVDEKEVPEEMWSRVRVKPGAVVTFIPRLQGDAARSILGVVIAVAAIIVAPYLAPGIVSGLAAIGVTGVSLGAATALAAGGIVAEGSISVSVDLWPR
jgi:predicted phage tail protein